MDTYICATADLAAPPPSTQNPPTTPLTLRTSYSLPMCSAAEGKAEQMSGAWWNGRGPGGLEGGSVIRKRPGGLEGDLVVWKGVRCSGRGLVVWKGVPCSGRVPGGQKGSPVGRNGARGSRRGALWSGRGPGDYFKIFLSICRQYQLALSDQV
jgi:hypothetical protein